MNDVKWTIHTACADYRSRHRHDDPVAMYSITFETHPDTLKAIRRYVVGSYRQTLSAFVDRQQPGVTNLSRRTLINIWRPTARNIVVNAVFAAHLANSTDYHREDSCLAST